MGRPPDEQPTVFSDEATRSAALAAAGSDATRPAGDPAATRPTDDLAATRHADRGPIASRTGIVFVHGIGTQGPAETFLDWSGPIVELLTDWQADQNDRAARAGHPVTPRIDDPVRRAEFAFNAASPPFLEITIPAHADAPQTTWVVTEAWWASDLRAPDLGRTIDYLGRRMRSVVSDIAAGYYRGRNQRFQERAQATDVIGPGPLPLDWRLVERLDLIQSRTFGSPIVGWTVGGAGVFALTAYDLLRRIPLPAIRDLAIRRMVDSFLLDWFGDLPVLLDEPVQAANVRARLARSIQRLVDDGCDAIVIVAHSGGAFVSFETLLDPAYAHLPVDKLVTLGQGLGLAWRLAADPDVHDITPGSRLVGDLAAVRPNLRWVDFWASYDPAPAGPLPARELESTRTVAAARESSTSAVPVATGDPAVRPWLVQAPVALPGEAQPADLPGTITIESRPVTNEMNVLTDHGAYWANPEGFLVPLVRHLDAARGDAAASRFYRDRADRTRRIVWRRERVAALAAWGWLCSLATIATAVGLVALQLAGDARLSRAGDLVVAVWDHIPGHEIVSGPVVAIGAVLGAVLDWLTLGGLADWLATLGPVAIGLTLTVALFFALAKIGTGRWHDWDRRERRAALPEIPFEPDRSGAGAEALLLLGGLFGLWAASFGSVPATAVAIALGAIAGAVAWSRHAFRTSRPEAPRDAA
jgi:hypothetical protein